MSHSLVTLVDGVHHTLPCDVDILPGFCSIGQKSVLLLNNSVSTLGTYLCRRAANFFLSTGKIADCLVVTLAIPNWTSLQGRVASMCPLTCSAQRKAWCFQSTRLALLSSGAALLGVQCLSAPSCCSNRYGLQGCSWFFQHLLFGISFTFRQCKANNSMKIFLFGGFLCFCNSQATDSLYKTFLDFFPQTLQTYKISSPELLQWSTTDSRTHLATLKCFKTSLHTSSLFTRYQVQIQNQCLFS